MEERTTLYRPVGAAELALIEAADYSAFPPRLPEQPFFYPVTTESYARAIASRWNARDERSGFVGYVTRFHVQTVFLSAYPIREVGGSRHMEYWIPADDLPQFNRAIVGKIEVIAEYRTAERLGSDETELRGTWISVDGEMFGDPVELRIEHLVGHVLVKIGTADGGWSTLYRDPADGRYWELTYPLSHMHGGGPKSLALMSAEAAAQKYPVQ
jgi:Immunity protein 27